MFKKSLAVFFMYIAIFLLAACSGDNNTTQLRVGMAYDSGGKGDGSFNDAAYAGLIKAQDELGAEIKEVSAEVNETDTVRQERLRMLANSGYNPVIAVGINYSSAVEVVAKEFPSTTFAIIDAEVAGRNIASLVFASEQGSYLVGVIAAAASKSGRIGFIGGMDIPLIKAFEVGYLQGARSVNPNVTLESAYMGAAGDASAWDSPESARIETESMLSRGIDIVYAAAGKSNIGMFQAIKSAGGPGKGLWGIGVDSDQYNMPSLVDVREVILTSMLKRVDIAVFEVVRGVAEGLPIVGIQNFDLKNNGVGYSSSNPAVYPYRDAANSAADRIIRGEIDVANK